ncbi:MAG: SRPBCC family protein [Thermoleophilia bacterium]
MSAGGGGRLVRAETLIAASPERVWALLTDLPLYPSWNRFMPRISGDLVPGGEVRAEVRFSRGFLGIPLRFRAQVLRCDSCREIRWVGKLLFSWLFGGVHSFVLEPVPASESGGGAAGALGVAGEATGHAGAAGGGPAAGGVLLVHREVLSGILLPIFGWYLAPLMEAGFREMNEAIRSRAESREAL